MERSTSQTVLCNILSFPGTGLLETLLGVTYTSRLGEQQTSGALACVELVVPQFRFAKLAS